MSQNLRIANLDGGSDHLFFAPSHAKAFFNEMSVSSKSARPFCKSKCFSSVRYKAILSGVTVLLPPCRPLTIFRRVRTIIVDTVNRMFYRRARPHISEKGFETVEPLRADLDTSSSIVGVRFFRWVVASCFHIDPNAVFRTFRHIMGFKMILFFQKASAGLGNSRFQRTSKNRSFFTTGTLADPHGSDAFAFSSFVVIPLGFSTAYNGKTAKLLPGEVLKSAHVQSPLLGIQVGV